MLDLRSGDLTRNGRPVRLLGKPRQVLMALAERPGELVTRAELHERLWPQDTFVDFENNLNAAMSRLREILQNNRQSPRYIETVRGVGYRFVVPVTALDEAASTNDFHPSAAAASPGETAETAVDIANSSAERIPSVASGAMARPGRLLWPFFVGCFVAALVILGGYFLIHRRAALDIAGSQTLVVTDFDNQTGDPRFNRALETALTVSLGQSRSVNIYSRLQTEDTLRLMVRTTDEPVTEAIGREICLRENLPALLVPSITRLGREYVLSAQLLNPSTGAVVRYYSQRVDGEDRILVALDTISRAVRRDLGESRLEIYRSHRPLPEVTTTSLAALEDYANGEAKYSQGQAESAVQLYRKAIAADPNFAMAHAALGLAYYSFYFNETQLGETEFRKALDVASRTTERERALIELHYAESQGRIEDALRLYQAYLQKYPGDWGARLGYARLLRMHGHAAQSVGIYQQVLSVKPDYAAGFVELAIAYDFLGQWSQAIQPYEKAFSIDPGQLVAGNINREYGFTLVRNEEDERAAQVFTALLGDPRQYANGERSLAFLDLYHGQYASARSRLLLALQQSTDPFSAARIHFMLAVVAAGQGNRREQIAQLDQIAANFSSLSQKVLYGSLVGQAYARAGEVAKATQMLAVIAPLVNERAEEQVAYAQLLKAEVAAAKGDYQTALQFLKPPGPNDSNASVVLTRESLAYIYQRLGRTDEAIAWYRQFTDSHDTESLAWEPQQQLFQAWYTLALDYQERGEGPQAVAAVSNLLDHWKTADSGLPLLKKARAFRDRLLAAP
jgi:DNA-binding winged helix-turn-helix (wHTH) protein/tetratricopeptide (TPR) repeat protein